MALQDMLAALRGGLQDVPDATPDDDLTTQAARTALRAGVVDALRKTVTNPASTGSWHGNFFIPNFQGFGNQVGAGLALPGQQANLLQAQQADRQAQMAAAQAALAQAPQAPGDQSAGPPIPGAMQDQLQGTYGSQLMQNPMTAKAGAVLLNKALSGGFAAEAQDRAEKIQDVNTAQQNRLEYLKQSGAQALAKDEAKSAQKIAEQAAKAQLNPKGLSQKDYVKLTGDLGSRLDKEGKKWGELVDSVDQIGALYTKPLDKFTPSDDYNLVYAYNHIMDPGSVVRESEFDNTLKMNPLVQQVLLKVGSVVDGRQTFTPETRKMLLDTVNLYSSPIKDRLYSLSDNYAQQAKNAGVDPNFVVTKAPWRNPKRKDLYEHEEIPAAAVNSAGQPIGVPAPPQKTPEGTIITPGGKPFPNSYKDPQWDDLENKVAPEYADKLRDIRLHGERSNSDQVSPTGARTPYQIVPGNREAYKSGTSNIGGRIDPYNSPEEAIQAAVQVIKDGEAKYGKDNWRKVLAHYSGNTPGYADRVLKKTAEAQRKRVEPTQAPLAQQGWSEDRKAKRGNIQIEQVD